MLQFVMTLCMNKICTTMRPRGDQSASLLILAKAYHSSETYNYDDDSL